jgi:5-formyltetrahydrofolate cyclo-ligase
MIKICENPCCKREFRTNGMKKRFCTQACRNEWHLDKLRNRREGKEEKPISQQVPELLEWKARYIKTFHDIEPVEQIAMAIKKGQAVIVQYCEEHGLPWFTRLKQQPLPDVTRKRRSDEEPEKKPIQRPPAVYDNQTRTYPYYIALL